MTFLRHALEQVRHTLIAQCQEPGRPAPNPSILFDDSADDNITFERCTDFDADPARRFSWSDDDSE